MANTYKNIVIVPNVGSSSGDPKIIFSGANTTVNTDITLSVNPTSNGTISLDGDRQLFSITNSMNGIIFSVNDINGIPNIEVSDTGIIRLSQYNGNVIVGSNTPNTLITANSTGALYTGNIVIGGTNTTGITFVDGTRQTTAATGGGADQWVRDTANVIIGTDASQNVRIDYSNTAITIIQGTDVGQNTRMTIADGVDVSQNTRIDYSNTAIAIIQGTDVSQNIRLDYSNTAISIIQGADTSQNVRLDYSNTAIAIIQGTDVGQNSRMTIIEGTDVSQNIRIDYSNTAITIIQGTDTSQNARMTIIEGTDVTQNTNIAATDGKMQSAYNKANTGGTFAGDVTITGNLVVNGVTTSVNTSTITTSDSLIKLANNNTAGDTVDIGFYGTYNNSGQKYAGLVRQAGSNFFLFKDITTDPTSNTLPAGSLTGANTGILNANVTGYITSNGYDIYNYVGSVYSLANTQSNQIVVIQGIDTSQNARMTIIEGTDVSQNSRMTIIEATDISQNTRIDYSNTAITILQGVNASQNVRLDYSNTAIGIIQGTDISQNTRMDYSNTAITIIQGTDVGQNSRMTIIEGVNASQNVRLDYSNTAITIIQGTDTSQNVRIDYSNTAITILQGVDAGQNANIALVQTLANTDFTNVSITATTSSSNGLYIPVITVAANGRVTAISNTLITTSGGGSSSGYLANSVIIANTTGYLSNTANLSFYTANSTLVTSNYIANGNITIANTATKNSATMIYNSTLNSIDFYFN